MNKKIIILLIILILIVISGIVAYVVTSENTDNSVKTSNNTTMNVTNTSIDQSNITNDKIQDLSKTVKVKEDYNFPTTAKIGKEDTIHVFYNSGFNGQENIYRGLLIFILNGSDPLEGNTVFKISYAVVKFQDNNNKTVYKTYNPTNGYNIREEVPKNLTPISATVYYRAK